MVKSFIIAKWEFIERVKRKSFLLSLIIMPLVILGFTLIPQFLTHKGDDFPLPLGVVDLTKKYHNNFIDEIVKNQLPNGQPAFFVFNLASFSRNKSEMLAYGDKQVLNNTIIGYVIIEEKNGIDLTFRTNDLFSVEKINLIENSFIKALLKVDSKIFGYEETDINFISSKIPTLKKSYIEADSEEELFKSFLNSYLLIILLITMVLFSGGMFVRSLILEKSNRIIELILSSCTSKELLLGKVLGLSFFGIFQFSIWIIIGLLLHSTNTLNFRQINNLEFQLLFFVLGYIFYSAIFIGLGSIVTVDHEAQQLTGYLSIFLILPIILAVEIIRAPNSLFSILLSYFPLTSSPVMLLRLNTTTPGIQEILSVISIILFSLYLVIFVSSKLFRIGILNTGKKPSFSEIIKWLKVK